MNSRAIRMKEIVVYRDLGALTSTSVGYQDAVRSLIPVNLEGLRANAAKSTIGG
jgi:hypothetical protein